MPKENIDKAIEYLEACTTPEGGIIYSYAGGGGGALSGQERPPLTAAAVCCAFSAGQYNDEYAKKWIKYCKENIPIGQGPPGPRRVSELLLRPGHLRRSATTATAQMFPDENEGELADLEQVQGSDVPDYLENQDKNADGSWTSGYIGPVFATAVNLTILQLEKGILPIYQR